MIKNYKLSGVSYSLQFGKNGNKIISNSGEFYFYDENVTQKVFLNSLGLRIDDYILTKSEHNQNELVFEKNGKQIVEFSDENFKIFAKNFRIPLDKNVENVNDVANLRFNVEENKIQYRDILGWQTLEPIKNLKQPLPLTRPSISGQPRINNTITLNPGTWDNNVDEYKYIIRENLNIIYSGTNNSFTINSNLLGKKLILTVYASNEFGVGNNSSLPFDVLGIPIDGSVFVSGNTTVGEEITVFIQIQGFPSPSITSTKVISEDGSVSFDVTNNRFTLDNNLLNRRFRIKVDLQNEVEQKTIFSQYYGPVQGITQPDPIESQTLLKFRFNRQPNQTSIVFASSSFEENKFSVTDRFLLKYGEDRFLPGSLKPLSYWGNTNYIKTFILTVNLVELTDNNIEIEFIKY